MRIIRTPFKRDPRFSLAAVLKIERLTRKIDQIANEEIRNYNLQQTRAGSGVPLTANGSIDGRTREAKAIFEAETGKPGAKSGDYYAALSTKGKRSVIVNVAGVPAPAPAAASSAEVELNIKLQSVRTADERRAILDEYNAARAAAAVADEPAGE